MAYFTGTATNASDLKVQLHNAFISAGWLENWSNGSHSVYKSPVNSFVGVYLYQDQSANSDIAVLWFNTCTSVVAQASVIQGHTNVPQRMYGCMVDKNLPHLYHFSINDRRAAGIIKVSQTYMSFYAGWFLPFGDPVVYPYPCFVGGNTWEGSGLLDWRSSDPKLSYYVRPRNGISNISNDRFHCEFMDPAGIWRDLSSVYDDTVEHRIGPFGSRLCYLNSFSTSGTIGGTYTNAEDLYDNLGRCFGDGYHISKVLIYKEGANWLDGQQFGVLDGIHTIPGLGQTAETTITDLNGVQHIVFQNLTSSDAKNYACMVKA